MKLKTLSANMYRQDLISAASKTFCHRAALIGALNPTFAECVSSTPCYVTVPEIVSYSFDIMLSKTTFKLLLIAYQKQNGSIK
jgi:hypothetical protein